MYSAVWKSNQLLLRVPSLSLFSTHILVSAHGSWNWGILHCEWAQHISWSRSLISGFSLSSPVWTNYQHFQTTALQCMKTQSQAKSAALIPMSTKPSPHTSPIKYKSPIMELRSPLVEENLPEPPIKDIEDTVPLPYDKLLSAVKSLGKSPSKPKVIGKLREPETFTSKDPIEAIFIPVQVVFPEPTLDFPGRQHQSQFCPILSSGCSLGKVRTWNFWWTWQNTGLDRQLEPLCWQTSNQFWSFWRSWWCQVRTGQLVYEEWSMNLQIPSPVQFTILSMSMEQTCPQAPFLQWLTF